MSHRSSAADRSPGQPGMVSRALHAEWTKLRTLRSTVLLVSGAVILTVLLSASAAGSAEPHTDLTKMSLTGVHVGQLCLVVLAILSVTGEYGTGTIKTTLLAVPSRVTVLLAKALTVTMIAVVVGTAGIAGSLAVGGFLLPEPWPGETGTVRAAAGTVLYLALVTLLGLGIATAVRDTVTAITLMLTLLYAFPFVAQLVGDPDWQRRLHSAGPMTAGLAIQATKDLDHLPIGPWPGLGVLIAYTVSALLLGTVLFRARDA